MQLQADLVVDSGLAVGKVILVHLGGGPRTTAEGAGSMGGSRGNRFSKKVNRASWLGLRGASARWVAAQAKAPEKVASLETDHSHGGR